MKWEYRYIGIAEWIRMSIAKHCHASDYSLWGRLRRDLSQRLLNECAQRKLRSTNEILNELGDEGWQLASSRPAVFGFLGMTWTVGFDMVFQREKVGPPSTGQGAPANG